MQPSSSARPLLFTIIGGLFLSIGLFSLLNVAVAFQLEGTFIWRSVLLALMDFTVAWGFFSRHSWLVWGFTLNAASQVLLVTLHWLQSDGSLILPLLGISLAFLLCGYVWIRRSSLQSTAYAPYVGAAFFLLWIISLGISVVHLR